MIYVVAIEIGKSRQMLDRNVHFVYPIYGTIHGDQTLIVTPLTPEITPQICRGASSSHASSLALTSPTPLTPSPNRASVRRTRSALLP